MSQPTFRFAHFPRFLIWFCCFVVAVPGLAGRDTGLPDLEQIFAEVDEAAFREILSRDVRVNTDLRPLLQDFGNLTAHQVLLAFRKLDDRFRILDSRITNSQSDTNYSWLEIYLNLDLEDKAAGRVYRVTFALHFKFAASKIALNRWFLQDIR